MWYLVENSLKLSCIIFNCFYIQLHNRKKKHVPLTNIVFLWIRFEKVYFCIVNVYFVYIHFWASKRTFVTHRETNSLTNIKILNYTSKIHALYFKYFYKNIYTCKSVCCCGENAGQFCIFFFYIYFTHLLPIL